MKNLAIYVDGASRGNPGPAGVGIVIYDHKGKVIKEIKKYIGKTTNNVAEYIALISALKEAKRFGACFLTIYLDSELLVNQINGSYRTKNKNLLRLLQEVRKLGGCFKEIRYQYIPRENNKYADKLANMAINLAVL